MIALRHIFIVLMVIILLTAGCRKKKETFGRLDEDGYIANPIAQYLRPEEYESLPPILVDKRNDEYRVWLTLEDWQEGESQWLKAEMTDMRGNAPHALSDFSITDSTLEIGENFKVRPLKIIWPAQYEYRLRKGEYGTLNLNNIKTQWTNDGTGYELSVSALIANISTYTMKLSGEFYLTGNDKVLISKLKCGTSDEISGQSANDSGFEEADSFYLCDIDGGANKELKLKTDKISKDILSKFHSLKLEHLAYGWQRNIEPPK